MTPVNGHARTACSPPVKKTLFKSVRDSQTQSSLSCAKTARKLEPPSEDEDNETIPSGGAGALHNLEVHNPDPSSDDDYLLFEDEYNPEPRTFVAPPTPANPYDPPQLTDEQMECLWYYFPRQKPFLNLHNVRAVFYPLVHPPPMVIDGVEHRFINLSILPDFILNDDRCLCLLRLKNSNDCYPFNESDV
jgi:hypothetical protein